MLVLVTKKNLKFKYACFHLKNLDCYKIFDNNFKLLKRFSTFSSRSISKNSFILEDDSQKGFQNRNP